MNRKEKKAIAKSKKYAAKAARYKRSGGTSRVARKKEWRASKLGGAPIPTVYGNASLEEAQKLYSAGVNVETEA